MDYLKVTHESEEQYYLANNCHSLVAQTYCICLQIYTIYKVDAHIRNCLSKRTEDEIYDYVQVFSDAERSANDHGLISQAEELQVLVGGPLNNVGNFQRWVLQCYTDSNDKHHHLLKYYLARFYEEDVFDVLNGDPTIKYSTTYEVVGLLRRAYEERPYPL